MRSARISPQVIWSMFSEITPSPPALTMLSPCGVDLDSFAPMEIALPSAMFYRMRLLQHSLNTDKSAIVIFINCSSSSQFSDVLISTERNLAHKRGWLIIITECLRPTLSDRARLFRLRSISKVLSLSIILCHHGLSNDTATRLEKNQSR